MAQEMNPPHQVVGGAQPAGGAGNPMQPVYSPNPPMGVASTSNVNLNPQHTIQEILKGFMPVQRQANSMLQNNLAASGIVGGGGQGASNLLQGQLASSIAPTLANAIQSSQGMGLQQALGNAGMSNQMTQTNLGDLMQNNLFNASSANNMRSQLANLLFGGWNTQAQGLSSLLNSGLGAAGGLAGNESNNFPVQGNTSLWGLLGL